MCRCGGVCRAVILSQRKEKKIEMREKNERGGRTTSIKWVYSSAAKRHRGREKKEWSSCCWWTVRDRSIIPTVWLSAQSQSIQYKSVRRSIPACNNTVSSWGSYRWQALINACLWSGTTLNTRLAVQCYLTVTLMAHFKCHVLARQQIGQHAWGSYGRQQFHGTDTPFGVFTCNKWHSDIRFECLDGKTIT